MPRNEQETERAIQAAGKTAPRLTPAEINDCIASTDYHVFNDVLTVCCMTLRNGFMVTGTSACASPENFDAVIGREVAYRNARDKIWELEGYLLREKLHQAAAAVPALLAAGETAKLDAKFYGVIRKVKDGSIVPDDQYMVFLAKDQAYYPTLLFYRDRCVALGADREHIHAVNRTIVRLEAWRLRNPDKLKVPDAKGDKLLG